MMPWKAGDRSNSPAMVGMAMDRATRSTRLMTTRTKMMPKIRHRTVDGWASESAAAGAAKAG